MQRPDLIVVGRPSSPTLVLPTNTVQAVRPSSPTLVLPTNTVPPTYVITNEPATQTVVQAPQVITRAWRPADVYYSNQGPYPGGNNTGVMVYFDQNKFI